MRRINFETDNFVPRLIPSHLSGVGMAFDLNAVQTEGANEAGVGLPIYTDF